jgi:hypothetical protein
MHIHAKIRDVEGEGMEGVSRLIALVAKSDIPVLLVGETGVGKSFAAEQVHMLSPRASNPLVVVDCGAVNATLLESELFGHDGGAFPGALHDRAGGSSLGTTVPYFWTRSPRCRCRFRQAPQGHRSSRGDAPRERSAPSHQRTVSRRDQPKP